MRSAILMKDTIAFIVWLVATTLLIGAGLRWSRWMFPRDEISAALVHVIVFCWACLVGNAFVLQLVGIFSPHNLICAVSLTSLVVWIWTTAAERPRESLSLCPTDRLGATRRTLDTPTQPRSLWWSVWVLMTALALGKSLLHAVTEFPFDWDSLA